MKTIKKSILLLVVTVSITACSNSSLPSGISEELSPGSDAIKAESEVSVVSEPTVESESAIKIPVSTHYAIGDIILADGSVVKETELTVIDSINMPIAVIAGFKENGTAFGVGVHRSDSPLPWAVEESSGYAANFADIACTQDSEFAFSGDRDGIDNWEAICTQDESGAADAADNYPAFDFVNTYGAVYDLTGDFASGWYMPSIQELCEVYQNRADINASLQKIYGLDSEAAMNGLETNWYWASSQAGSEETYAWFVHYFNGYAGECPKNFTNVHVLAVHEFIQHTSYSYSMTRLQTASHFLARITVNSCGLQYGGAEF